MNYDAEYYIEKLKMEPHYEGGWFKFIWKCDKSIPREILGDKYNGNRATASVIYFLLKAGEISTWHRLTSDEMWFWHAGGALRMSLGGNLDMPIKSKEIILGTKLHEGEQLQSLVPAGVWQTSTPVEGADFVLVSCVVTPGFEDEDFMFPQEGKKR